MVFTLSRPLSYFSIRFLMSARPGHIDSRPCSESSGVSDEKIAAAAVQVDEERFGFSKFLMTLHVILDSDYMTGSRKVNARSAVLPSMDPNAR